MKNLKTYPLHIAFIMDGNRRWAKKRRLQKYQGHLKGAEALKDIIFELSKIEKINREKEEYTSFNTDRLDKDGVIKTLLKLDYVQAELNSKEYIGVAK